MVAGLVLAVGLTLSSALPAPQADGVRALLIQYADGRKSTLPLSTSGRGAWTPMFPRIDGAATDRDGLELKALQYEQAPDPQGLTVTVALLYGTPHQKRIQVAAVRVTGEEPVRVDALESFGVKPVLLSLVPLPVAMLHLPSVMTPSSMLEVTVEIVTTPMPAYHATIVN